MLSVYSKLRGLILGQRLKYLSLVLLVYIGSMINATAHNVVGGAYVDGQTIEGEIGFSSGDMALPNILVEAFNEAGDKLGETKTLQDGIFLYPVKQFVTHIFKADLSAGHVVKITVEADELNEPVKPSTTGVQPNQNTNTAQQATMNVALLDTSTKTLNNAHTTISLTPEALKQLISSTVRQAVAKQVKPLQKDLRAYKEKVMLRDIAGGIGFILGIFGIAAWMASRKQNTSQTVAKQ